MNTLCDLDFYLQQHVFSYCAVVDLCNLLCASKKIQISRVPLRNVTVNGFNVYDFVLWLKKHEILSIFSLKIENYYLLNDHCMTDYKEENCNCIEVITKTLSNLQVHTLTLQDVDLDNHEIHWSSLEVLSVIDCRFKTDWINLQKSLKKVVVNNYSPYYFPEPLLNDQIILCGLKLPQLEYFESNGFVFMDQLNDFLEKSDVIDTLRSFRIQNLLDSENDYTILISNIKKKFKNTTVEIYV